MCKTYELNEGELGVVSALLEDLIFRAKSLSETTALTESQERAILVAKRLHKKIEEQ